MGSTMKERFSEGFSKLSERLNDGFSKLGSSSTNGPEDDAAGVQEPKRTGSGNKKSFSEHLSTATAKMKDMFRTPTIAERLVEEATASGLEGPDWAKILAICDLVNTQRAPGQEVTLAVKKRLAENDHRVQGLALILLESLVKNCEGVFSDVASARVLDDLVSLGRETGNPNSTKALILIEAWGEAKDELRYLPVFAETYTSLQAQGVRFPGRDAESLGPIFTPVASVPVPPHPAPSSAVHTDAPPEVPPADLAARSKETFEVARNSRDLLDTVLTSAPQEETLKAELTVTLVAQVQRSQREVQQLIQVAGDNEAVLFEALNVNDELQRSLSKYEELAGTAPHSALVTRPEALTTQRPIPNSTSTQAKPAAASAPENPQAAVYAELLGEDEDEDESALVRKNGHKNARPAQGGEDQALADLDEMIFGKKESTDEAQAKKEKRDDLISF